MTGDSLLKSLRRAGSIEHAFRFPYAYIRCVSPDFEGRDEDEREALAATKIGRSVAEIRKTAADCMFTLEWMTPAEAARLPAENRGEYWLRAFIEAAPAPLPSGPVPASVRVVHFFGYKGGQGRSTVLSCLAQRLASEGVKVLALDADIEAPSLDVLFGTSPNGLGSTVLGLVQRSPTISAMPALQGRDGGEVRLIACRPRDPAYDIDFAAFAMQTSLVPGILSDALARIGQWAREQRFDVILVDHRSGMAMTTLTWMKALPGPVAVFAKLDEQWRGAESVLREVLDAHPANPGVVVTFKPDNETDDSFRRRTVRQRTDLLRLLADAVAGAIPAGPGLAADDNLADPASVDDRWIVWPYHEAFRAAALPDAASLGAATLTVLGELIRLLDIPVPSKRRLSSIGSVDRGDLIQTDALRKLSHPGNGIRYIFGRKGTGKTRLATELAAMQLAQPLLVDAGSTTSSGMPTAEVEFGQARDRFRANPDRLWWGLLLVALQAPDTGRAGLRSRLAAVVHANRDTAALQQSVLESLPTGGTRTFLLDGVETAFGVTEVYPFVEKLFQFMLTLQSDERFVGRVEVKLFLRTDLAVRSVQNLEQQIGGRDIRLFWDYQRILCFLLSRLPDLPFFRKMFPEMIADIQAAMPSIRAGEMPADAGEEILLQSLPRKLSRSNIHTSTFLRLHFSDSSDQGNSYYPRVIDRFLEALNDAGGKREDSSLVDGRLDQQLLVRAHEQACADYMAQIQQELQHLLDFGLTSPGASQSKLYDWLAAFADQTTPFGVEEMEAHLAARVGLERSIVRRCLDQMRTLGIFERTAELPNTWRTGRLFKSSLRMKYRRV